VKKIEIKRNNFKLAKNRIKKFYENESLKLTIEGVEAKGGLFNLFDHKVSGVELNNRINAIQRFLNNINRTNNNIISEFGEIYNTFEALDKEYLASIMITIKSVEKTSNDVRIQQGIINEHNNKLRIQQNKLDAHQIKINKNFDNIKKIVMKIKNNKEKIDNYKYFSNIDIILSNNEIILHTAKEQKLLLEKIDQFNEKYTARLNTIIQDKFKIKELTVKNKEHITLLTKKIKYAYWISGIAIGLVIIEMILLFAKEI